MMVSNFKTKKHTLTGKESLVSYMSFEAKKSLGGNALKDSLPVRHVSLNGARRCFTCFAVFDEEQGKEYDDYIGSTTDPWALFYLEVYHGD